MLPEFNAQGLTLKEHVYGFGVSYRGNNNYSYDALAKFFDITSDESTEWFYPYSYDGISKVTPQMVANKMRKYLRKVGEETGTVARKASERRSNYLTRKLAR